MDWKSMPIGCKSSYLDSGSFSLVSIAKEYKKANGGDDFGFYRTPAFWQYVDEYATFIRKYRAAIDLFSNVDVIPNPELTWKSQMYMERVHGLVPVPVVHYRTNPEQLIKYVNRGMYPIIALGGLVGSTNQEECRTWIDECFHTICNPSTGIPYVKLHGFGITSWSLLFRYPWWSVDSSTWTKVGAYGGILVPHRRHGQFIFTEAPYLVKVSHDSPDRKLKGKHLTTLTPQEQSVVHEWLNLINIPLGHTTDDGETTEVGVVNHHSPRKAANILFFEKMRQSVPEWPWPFLRKRKRTFGVLC